MHASRERGSPPSSEATLFLCRERLLPHTATSIYKPARFSWCDIPFGVGRPPFSALRSLNLNCPVQQEVAYAAIDTPRDAQPVSVDASLESSIAVCVGTPMPRQGLSKIETGLTIEPCYQLSKKSRQRHRVIWAEKDGLHLTVNFKIQCMQRLEAGFTIKPCYQLSKKSRQHHPVIWAKKDGLRLTVNLEISMYAAPEVRTGVSPTGVDYQTLLSAFGKKRAPTSPSNLGNETRPALTDCQLRSFGVCSAWRPNRRFTRWGL
jgi:hypothetical protein